MSAFAGDFFLFGLAEKEKDEGKKYQNNKRFYTVVVVLLREKSLS